MITQTENPVLTALESIDEFIGPDPTPKQQLVRAKIRGLFRGYVLRYGRPGDTDFMPVSVEETITADLYNLNPELKRKSKSRTFKLAGKIDLTANWNGRFVFPDHKTTSEEIESPDASYWRQLQVDSQISHYLLMLYMHGITPECAIWNVVKKPTINPKKLTKKDKAEVLDTGGYFGMSVPEESLERLESDPEGREDLALYEMRLFNDCCRVRPGFYFQRREFYRTNNQIADYAMEVWGHSQDLISYRVNDRWPMNSGACMAYGTPCKFLGICSGMDSPDSGNWKQKPAKHAELDELDGGWEYLTNSRIKCLQSCRRKHLYEYELGIERNTDETSDALYFGNVWHHAMETYYGCFLDDA